MSTIMSIINISIVTTTIIIIIIIIISSQLASLSTLAG